MKTAFPTAAAFALVLSVSAAEPAWMGLPGKVLYENALASVPDGWKAAKGRWEEADGALRGAERPEDNHGAVIRLDLPLTNFIVQYEVKLDGAKLSSLSINDPKGHLARISITTNSVRITKDDHDKDGPDKPAVIGALKADLAAGAWHTVRLEIVGDAILGKVDGVSAFGSHEQLSAAKSNLGLTVSGQSAVFRNLKIWQAAPNPDWDKVKASLPKGDPLPPPRVPAPRKKAAP